MSSKVKSRENIKRRLESLGAYLESFTEGAEKALMLLEDKDDPESIRRRLMLLLDTKREAEAAISIKNIEPHERWCELGVFALALNDDLPEAKKIINWAKKQQDLLIIQRCRIAFAEAQFERIFKKHKDRDFVTSFHLKSEEKDWLKECLETINPTILQIIANSKITNNLELRAVEIAFRANSLLENKKTIQQLIEPSLNYHPIPIVLGEAILNSQIYVSSEIPDRIRKEHPDSIRAKIIAAFIEGEIHKKPEKAFTALLSITEDVKADRDQKELCKALYQFAQSLGREERKQAEQIASKFLEEKDSFIKLIKADRLLREGDTERAISILENIANERDPNWLQIYASSLLQKGENELALKYLLKAIEILPHPDILKKAAAVAYDNKKLDISLKILKKAIKSEPENISTYLNIANIYILREDYTNAGKQFRILKKFDPEEQSHRFNLANCLAHSGKIDESIKIYDEICNQKNPPLQAILSRSQLLMTANRVKDAFESLIKFRNKFWDKPEFVSSFMSLSYAAGEEKYANEAFLQIQKLQKEGKAKDILRAVSIDELKEHAQHWRKQSEFASNNIIKGILPWLMADELIRRVSYIGWLVRTQPLAWFNDDPVIRATYSIYSTNGFHVRKNDEDKPILKRLSCPPIRSDVVIDLSALITLHRLDLLEESTQYFNKIFVPSIYLTHMIEEKSKLVPHQLSLKTATEQIKAAIDSEKIKVLKDIGAPNKRPMPYINEHTITKDEEEHYYRIKDLLSVVHDFGEISDIKSQEIASIAHKPKGADGEKYPHLNIGQSILIDVLTLRTLSNVDALDSVLYDFSVHISSKDRDIVTSDMATIINQDLVQKWHSDLWEKIRDAEQFVHTAIPLEQISDDEKQNISSDVSISAPILAQQTKMPLLADDRVCQVIVLNDRPSDRYAAFSTDHLLIALEEAGIISTDRLSETILQLMRWRYRFIIPNSKIIKTIADKFKEHPPGKELREVALYLHDCMRDPGLFSGPEKSDPPQAMASKLFIDWTSVVANFVMDIWSDESYPNEKAELLTEWSLNELLPSPPKTLGLIGLNIAKLCPKAIITTAMLRAGQMQNSSRANQSLLSIAKGLGLDEKGYLKVITENINDFRV